MTTNPITSRREELGLARRELAITLEVSVNLVSGWERGEAVPPNDRLADLADVLGCAPETLEAELTNFRAKLRRSVRHRIAAAA